MDVGGYLTRLETQYGLIVKKQPVYERSKNKNCLYQIDDCFFRFWFRFVVGYQEYIELRRLEELREIVRRDFNQFSGYALERYFYWKFVEETHFVRMGGWWDRKGENEIDLVCEDGGSLVFCEIKRDKDRISLKALESKTTAFFAKNPSLKAKPCRFLALSLDEM